MVDLTPTRWKRAVLGKSGTVERTVDKRPETSGTETAGQIRLIVSGGNRGQGRCRKLVDLIWREELAVVGVEGEGESRLMKAIEGVEGSSFLRVILDWLDTIIEENAGNIVIEESEVPLEEEIEELMNDWRNERVRCWVKEGDGKGHLKEIRERQKAFEIERERELEEEGKRLRRMKEYGKASVWLEGYEDRWGQERVDDDWRARLSEQLQGKQTITLDIWDTLLLRKVVEPKDVFRLLGIRWEKRLGMDAELFAETRVSAENELRVDWQQGGKGEDVDLDSIYEQLGKKLQIDEGRLKAIQVDELELESMLIYGNEKLLEAMSNNWERVRCCISEMYIKSSVLEEWIHRETKLKKKVYVSGETGLSKGSGRLYGHVLKAEGMEPREIVHIGDNGESDVKVPRSQGLDTYHWTHRPEGFIDEMDRDRTFSGLESRVCLGLARWYGQGEKNLAERIGFELFGPMLWGYLNWLKRQPGYTGADRLWFVARDGYYLKKGLELLPAAYQPSGKVEYLLASRKLLGLAAIDQIEAEDWDFLLKAAPNLRAGDFFRRIGVNPELFAERFEAQGLRSIDEVLTWREGYLDDEDRDRLYHLFVEQIERFHEVRKGHRERVFAYLRSKRETGEKTVVVDLGWHGSSLKALSRIFREGGEDLGEGYYFASWEAAQELEERGIGLRSFFAHLGETKERVRLLEESIPLVEFFFSAPHGSVVGLKGDEGAGFEPEVESAVEESERRLREKMWAGAQVFLEEMGRIFIEPSAGDPHEYLETALERMLRFPKREEASVFKGLRHAEGWGLNRTEEILPTVSKNGTAENHLKLLMRSGWPKGWLAMRTEAEIEQMKQFLSGRI